MSEILLGTKNLSKRFGGIRAVSNMDISIYSCEILGLIGPNGGGKTTLFNLISGFLKPDTGKIYFKGEKITNMKSHEIVKALATRPKFILLDEPIGGLNPLEIIKFFYNHSRYSKIWNYNI